MSRFPFLCPPGLGDTAENLGKTRVFGFLEVKILEKTRVLGFLGVLGDTGGGKNHWKMRVLGFSEVKNPGKTRTLGFLKVSWSKKPMEITCFGLLDGKNPRENAYLGLLGGILQQKALGEHALGASWSYL